MRTHQLLNLVPKQGHERSMRFYQERLFRAFLHSKTLHQLLHPNISHTCTPIQLSVFFFFQFNPVSDCQMNCWGHQSKFKLKLSDGLDHPINMNLGYTLPNMAPNISIVWISMQIWRRRSIRLEKQSRKKGQV